MILLAARLAVNTNANILDDVDPATEHPQITDYTHPIDPWGSATLGVDNGKVCFWGATDLSFANSSAREYCGRVYGYTGPTLIAAQSGVFLPGGADENAGLDARRRHIRMPQTTRPASTDSVHPHSSVHQHALCLARRAVACRSVPPPASRHSIAAFSCAPPAVPPLPLLHAQRRSDTARTGKARPDPHRALIYLPCTDPAGPRTISCMRVLTRSK